MTQSVRTLVGIIGYPLGHSASPVFQQAAFDRLGLPFTYDRWPTPPDALSGRTASLRAQGIAGANVTVPHKEAVLPLLDEVEPQARRIGAVNTIVNRSGRLTGYNTDAPGFVRSLKEDAGFDPTRKLVLLLGAGGAARAVVFGLGEAGAAAVLIANRTADRAEALAASARSAGVQGVEAAPWGQVPAGVDLIVNSTSLGMRGGPGEQESPLPASAIPKGALVCDLVYNPPETPLLRDARSVGARTLGGLPMLIYQGALAFELWTGRNAPVDVMFEAARRALHQ
jgi:shikimate dehydrogenase